MSKRPYQPARWRLGGHSSTARLLVGIALVGVAFLTLTLLQTWHWTHKHIDSTADRQAQLAIEFDRAIRGYVRKHIRPEFAERLQPDEFIPEVMSTSLISRSIFEDVRETLPDSLLRFPSTNPRNPINRATQEEETLLRYFVQNPDAKVWTGTIRYGAKGDKYFVRAVPYPYYKECLSCHGTPGDAPAALLERYGPEAGFGRSEGDMSLELVALPVQAYYAEADSHLRRHMVAAMLVCLLFLAGIGALVAFDAKSRNQSRRQLELSNRRFDQIGEHSRTIAWEIDPDGRFTYVSEAAEIVLGLSPESLVGKDCLIAHPEKGREEFRALLHDTITRKEAFHNLENPVETPDGRIVWVATSGFPILAPDGTLLGYRGSAIDITERRRAERTLRENERKLAAIVEGLPIPAFVIDRDHRVVHWNRALEQMTGILAKDVIGTNGHWQVVYETERPCLADLLVDDAADAVESWYANACQKSPLLADAYEGTAFFEPVDREGRWLHFTATAFRDADGRIVGAIETLQDITERKEAARAVQEALAEAERSKRKALRMAEAAEAARAVASEQSARIQAMIGGMKEGVVFADADGIVVEVNDFFCDFLHHGRDELLGRSLGELHRGEVRERVLQAVERFSVTRDAPPLEIQRELCGSHVIMRMQPVYNADVFAGVLLNVIDVSDLVAARCQAEAAHRKAVATSRMLMEETQRSQALALQAQAACNSKSEFLANMSHELRTPMTAILGFAEALLGELGEDQVDAARRHAVTTIRRNGEHLLSLINDVLDLSKIEAGRLDLNKTPCSPAVILAEVGNLMRLRAEEKHLSLTVEYLGPIPRHIQTDPLRLRQILINLVGNAIKFTERGGVRVVGSMLQLPGRPSRIRFDVVDTGIGIAEWQIPRLFQPFTQADESTTREFGGTGLGLTISKRFAEMLGGDISVASVPGEGSTFTLTIETGPLDGVPMHEPTCELTPLEAVREESPPETIVERDAPLDCRVLLAEDSPDIQRLVAMVLQKAGASVTTVGNGRLAVDEALDASERGCPFGVVLMDMQMPVMDGYLAARTLRDRGYQGVIIALTAHAMTGDRRKCLDAGCDDYTSKPIDRAGLLEVVARHAASADHAVLG